MLSFVFRRLVVAIPTLFVIITLSFFLMRIAPGGPFDLERPLEPLVMENIKRAYGLDLPLYQQYFRYLGNLLQGDLGPSFFMRDFTVNQILSNGLPVSMLLGGLALALALVVGCTLGSYAGLKQNTNVDYLVVAFATFGITIPGFVVAPLFQVAFGKGPFGLGIFPVAGWGGGDWRHLVMPVIVLALPQIAVIARLTRGAMIEALRSDHIRTLRSLGMPTITVLLHALRGALLPIISYLGPAAAALLTGSVVVETIFGLPGMGRYFAESALNRDYTMVMGTVVVVAVFVLLFNLVVDIVYALLDPRVRYE